MPIKIDPEFVALIPPLAPEEFSQLEANLKKEGCRDAIVVWKGQDILLDGHNRKRICEKLGIGFRVIQIDLPDRDAAMDWIDAHQLGRRNLAPEQMSLIRGRVYNRAKRQDGGHENLKKGPDSPEGQSVPPGNVAVRVASEHGVSARTTKRDGAFAAAVEKLRPVFPDLPAQIASGKGPSKAKVIAASKDPDRAAEILYGQPPPAPAAAPAGPTDVLGIALPDKQSVKTAFARLGEVKALQREVSTLKGKLVEAAARPKDPIFAALDVAAVKADLEHVYRLLKAIAPFTVCPYCLGGDRGSAGNCMACNGLGWLSEYAYRKVPKELQHGRAL